MTDAERLADLHKLMMSAPDSRVTRVVAILVGLTLVGTILWLVRERKLREEYTPIWMVAGLALAVISVRFDLLHDLTRAIGAWTPSSTIFFFGLSFLTAVSLNYAVRLSRTSVQLKNLAQEVALLRAELEAATSPALHGSGSQRPAPVGESG